MTELEERAVQGDQEAFAQLVEDNQRRVYNLALRMVRNPSDAEDLAQTAFLNAWRGMAFFKGESSFSTWVYRLTTNACIDFLRREWDGRGQAPLEDEETGAAVELPDQEPGPQEQLERRERRRALERALEELPPDYRRVLEMRAIDQLSYEEIGQLLDLPAGTVKSRIYRGRMALKNILTQDGNFSAFLASMKEESGKGGDRP